MKKFLFGAILFLSGLFGIINFINMAVENPASYDEWSGLKGFLLTHNIEFLFNLLVIATISGLIICGIEAFKRTQK